MRQGLVYMVIFCLPRDLQVKVWRVLCRVSIWECEGAVVHGGTGDSKE